MLRNYLYFDRTKIERYLSSLQDGFTKERRVTKEEQKSRVSGKLDAGIISLGGETGIQSKTTDEIKKLSDTSLFDELEKIISESRTYIHLPGEILVSKFNYR